MASGIKKSKAPKKEKEVKRIGIPLSAWHFLNLPGISLKNVVKK